MLASLLQPQPSACISEVEDVCSPESPDMPDSDNPVNLDEPEAAISGVDVACQTNLDMAYMRSMDQMISPASPALIQHDHDYSKQVCTNGDRLSLIIKPFIFSPCPKNP